MSAFYVAFRPKPAACCVDEMTYKDSGGDALKYFRFCLKQRHKAKAKRGVIFFYLYK